MAGSSGDPGHGTDLLSQDNSSPVLGSILISGIYLMIAYLGHRCHSDPNKNEILQGKRVADKGDRTWERNHKISARLKYNYVATTLLPFVHAILTLFPSLRARPNAFCAHPEHLYGGFFKWSWAFALFAIISITSGLLRILVYAQLGTDFTYRLTRTQNGLQTKGLYRYVRHPSYAAGITFTTVVTYTMTRLDSGVGCAIPTIVFQNETLFMSLNIILGALAPACWIMIVLRLKDEEAFLHQQFGAEWRAYAARTKMLAPGVY